MLKFKYISLIIVLPIISIWAVKSNASLLNLADLEAERQIKQTIEAYFEARYRAHSSLQLEDIGKLIDNSSQADDFRHSELEKLGIEFYHAKVKQLRYVDYKFILEFKAITIDDLSQTATVSIIEGHDVVFENSGSIVSSMRNLPHTIVLHKSDDAWKIVTDNYEDYLWRLLKTTIRSKNDILHSIDKAYSLSSNLARDLSSETTCSLSSDESTYNYANYGAVEYAHNWAFNRNPNYYDFSELGGDCTNFVSQAIHDGGFSSMEFGGTHDVGTNGWYYFNVGDRAAAWNDVERLYSFIVGETYLWNGGPEGCEVASEEAQVGDIIQYDRDGDELWDHSVIIVTKGTGGQGYRYYVAGHTPDVDEYPYDSFDYDDIRFIHIERIDGYIFYLPLEIGGGSGGEDQIINPYPAPLENGGLQPLPYPEPIDTLP